MSTRIWDAEQYDSGFGFVAELGEGVADWLAPRPGERILDLGCGTGSLTEKLLDAGADVNGIDADPEMVRLAKERLGDDRAWQADGTSFEVDEPMDAVFSNAALHWMKPPEAVAAAVRGALKPGGRFVAEMGAKRNIQTLHDAARATRERFGLPVVEEPNYFPSPAEHAAVLEGAGFDVVRMDYFSRPTPMESDAAAWVRMMSPHHLAGVAEPDLSAFFDNINELAAPTLLRDGQWTADYWRLRFKAVVA